MYVQLTGDAETAETSMATYLDRYLRGEHERVWDELVALGERVREPAVNDDAVAVARETMRRARANAERMVERLREMGFAFAYPNEAFVPPAPGTADVIESVERRIGPLPIALRAFYETVGSVCLMGSHPGLSTHLKQRDPATTLGAFREIYERNIGPLPPAPNASGASPAADLTARLRDAGVALPPASADMIEQLVRLRQAFADQAQNAASEAERMMTQGAGPSASGERSHRLALDVYRQMMLRKSKAGSAMPAVVSDPLVVEPLRDDDPDSYRYYGAEDRESDNSESDESESDDSESDDGDRSGRYAIDVAPDAAHKSGYSGGGPYQILLPNASADAPLVDSPYPSFVAYLRESFRWGGFPGLARYPAPKELTRLTEGLELI